MRRKAAVFEGHGERFVADSCEPLRAAAERGDVALQALSRGSYPGRRLQPGELPELRSAGVWDASRDQRWGLAYACGFETSQYFATVFRHHTGRSPSAYRAELARAD